MDIRIDDLFIQCEQCGGTGWYEEKRDGSGRSQLRSGTCPACGGMRGALTNSGQVLADFLQILRTQNRL
jgi:Zn finger protein HypA/HybF involved in hydrogenase expression